MKGKYFSSRVLHAAIVTLIYAFVSFYFVHMRNSEFENRATRTFILAELEGEGHPIDVTLLLHRLDREENAIEASYIVTAYGRYVRDEDTTQSCMSLEVSDRSPQFLIAPRTYEFPCGELGGMNYSGGQTPRFMLPTHPEVASFPFDRVTAWPSAFLRTREGNEAIRYRVAKMFPDKVLEAKSDDLQWELRISRSSNAKLIIVVSAVLFVALSLMIAIRIWTAGRKMGGMEEVLTVGGYIIAAVGFREVLGVSSSSSATTFEILVFLLPLCCLIAIMIWTHFALTFSAEDDTT